MSSLDQYLKRSEETAKRSECSPPAKIEDRRRDRNEKKRKNSREPSARLQDLCPADKQKIGELVKKLATETRVRQESEQRFLTEKLQIEEKLKQLENQTKAYDQEREMTSKKLQKSLSLLSQLKNEQNDIEQLRMDQAAELLQIREELLKAKQAEQDLISDKAKHQHQYEQQIREISAERQLRESQLLKQIEEKEVALKSQQDLLSSRHTEFDSSKELGDLKSQIQRLTESFQKFAHEQKSDSARGSSAQLEVMDLEELHSVQENLIKQLAHTSTLIQNRSRDNSLQGSARGNDRRLESSTKLKQKKLRMNRSPPTKQQDRQQRILSQAYTELDAYKSDSDSSDQPRPLQVRPEVQEQPDAEILSQKLQVYQQIKDRLKSDFKTPAFLRSTEQDSDEDLAFTLNQHQFKQTAPVTPFSDNLFNIIDEIEQDQKVKNLDLTPVLQPATNYKMNPYYLRAKEELAMSKPPQSKPAPPTLAAQLAQLHYRY